MVAGIQDESFQSGTAVNPSTTYQPSIFIWLTDARDEYVLAGIYRGGGITSEEISEQFNPIISAMESNILDAAL